MITILAVNRGKGVFDPYYGFLKGRGVEEKTIIFMERFENLWMLAYNSGWMAYFARKIRILMSFRMVFEMTEFTTTAEMMDPRALEGHIRRKTTPGFGG